MLGHQLYALGIVDTPNLVFDSDAVNMLTEMYHDHGDSTVVFPIPSSHRTTDAPSSHCPAVHRQRARQPRRDLPADAALELALSGYHRKPQAVLCQPDARRGQASRDQCLPGYRRRSSITGKRLKFGGYDAWYDTKHLERPLYDTSECSNGMCEFVDRGGSRGTTAEFWVEYYRPLLFTSLGKHFAWGMNSTLKLPGYVL
jgi:hypothetical protein